MAEDERRNSWGYDEPEDNSPKRLEHPQGDYPKYEHRTRSREYHRNNSDYQSRDSRDEYRQSPHQSDYESTGYRHQSNHGSRSHHRDFRRDDSHYTPTEYPRDQAYYPAPPSNHYPPRQRQPRDSDYDRNSDHSNSTDYPMDHGYYAPRHHHPRGPIHYSRKPRDSYHNRYNEFSPPADYHMNQGYPAYRQPRFYQEREVSRYPRGYHFNNRDRGHRTRDVHNFSPRSYNPRYNTRNSNTSDENEFDYISQENSNQDEQTQKYLKSPLERQNSEPCYPLSRLPKARSRCSSTSSEFSKSRDDCVICYGTVTHLAMTPCEHSYCHLCCVRLQVLCEDHHCPICRTPFEEDNPVILLPLPTSTPLYKELVGSSRFCEFYNVALIPPLTKKFIDRLFDLKCHVDGCQFFSHHNNHIGHLEKHLKFTHELYYCHVCLYGLKQFVFEMRLYTWEQLNLHKDGKGDEKLDPPGHKGHPMCRFCKERLLDESTLYEHLHKNHFWCYICERDGFNEYYQNQDELRAHFKQEHFLCERGDCRNEVFTSVFSSDIDLKAHIASVHAGDLKKNEAKNLRRVDLEFNYSSHQTTGEQGYRHRRQPRERRGYGARRGGERRDQSSDEDEMNADSFEPTADSNQSEYNSEKDCDTKQDVTSQNIKSNADVAISNEKAKAKNDSETEGVLLEPSVDNSTDNWPQVGVKKSSPESVVTNPKPTPVVTIPTAAPVEVAPSAFSYSKSLGIGTQPPKPKQQPPRVNQVSVPSPYSDALKPESQRAQKPQNQDLSQSDHPPKQTYEDVFPALCATNVAVTSPQPEKQTQSQPNSITLFPSAKTGKKSNKQRKKDYKIVHPPSTQPIPSFLQGNTTENIPRIKPPPKDRSPPQPARPLVVSADTKPKSKKLSSPSRSRKIIPTEGRDSKAVQSKWRPPQDYKQRKSTLDHHIRAMSKVNPLICEFDVKYEGLLDKSLPVKEFFQFCVNSFGVNFPMIFPELLVLVPDIILQQELLRAKEKLYPSAIFKSFPSSTSTSSWSHQAHIQLETCQTCAQVVLSSDVLLHNGSHSTNNEFPALC